MTASPFFLCIACVCNSEERTNLREKQDRTDTCLPAQQHGKHEPATMCETGGRKIHSET